MKALLVRVGADQTEGGGCWNGPVNSVMRKFVYVPIPESKSIRNVHIDGTDPEAVTKYLFDKHYITTPIVHEEFQGIRIMPNVYTILSELDRFCEQIELIARHGLPS
jgi:hypothetical protein